MRSELEEKVRNEYDEYTKRVLAGDKIAYDKFLADSTFLFAEYLDKTYEKQNLKNVERDEILFLAFKYTKNLIKWFVRKGEFPRKSFTYINLGKFYTVKNARYINGQRTAKRLKLVSLDQLKDIEYSFDDGQKADTGALYYSYDKGCENIEESIDAKYLKEDFLEYLDSITERQKEIMIKYCGLNGEKPKSVREVAKELGCSSSFVEKIILKVRKRFLDKQRKMEEQREAL